MSNTLWRIPFLFLILLVFSTDTFAGNAPCGATPISNSMTDFQTYTNAGNTNSGVPDPGCGNYVNADFWFSVTVPASGMLDIATLAGGMSNAAMAIYSGSCANPDLISCTEDDNCGNTIMPIMNLTGLTPGTTLYIRIWAEGGGPNGTFEIRVSDGPIQTPPIPTTATVGTAQYTADDCVQLTVTTGNQTGCAWDPDQIDLSQPFDETFLFNFGNNDGGADGICWVFQNSPAGLNACGDPGQNIAGNIGNSFIVEFDTWDNGGGFSDIPTDHVSVNVNGDMGSAINGPFNLGNIEDGQDHEIRLVWDPATNNYEIYFDGGLTLSGNYDIITNCLGGNPNCYWGFTASTGGATNNHTVCPVPVPEYPAGDESTVEVEICEGESYFAGGANQTTSGFYTDITPLPNGCNSTLNTNLIVNPAGYFTYDAAVCQGDCETVGTETFCTSGVHEVTLDNQAFNGCDSIVTLNLTVLNPIAVAFDPAPITCFNLTTSIDASPSTSGPGIVSYSWTGPTPDCFVSGQNSATPVVNCPGDYTMTLVQILNGTACSAQTTVEVFDGAILPTVEAGDDASFDCVTSCVNLSSAGSDTGVDITLTWTGPGVFSSTEPNPEVCEPGVYTLTILNQATGCLASDFVTVTGDSNPPDASAVVSGLLTCNETEVSLDGSSSTGTGNLTYEWFDNTNTSIGETTIVDVTEIGTYTLVITDDENGCTADTTIIVDENTNEPNAIATASEMLDCTDNPVTLSGASSTGVGMLSYEWQSVSGDSLGEGVIFDVTNPGVYILVITDSDNGCTASTSVQVFQSVIPPNIEATVSGLLTCTDLEVTLIGTGSTGVGTISYEWQDSDANTIGMMGTTNVGSTGVYTLIITDSDNGCTASTTINVGEDIESPEAIAITDDLLTCVDLSATLDGTTSVGTGMLTYEWQDVDGNIIGMTGTVNVSNINTYTLIVTDAANGCIDSTTINADEDLLAPNPDITADGELTCADMEVQLDGSGSTGTGTISYEWFDIDDNSLGIDETVGVSTTDTYTLVITDDSNGCTAMTSFNPEEDMASPNAVATTDELLTCAMTEVLLSGSSSTGTGNITYEWFDTDDNSIGMEETVEVSNTATYTLVITDDSNGCTAETTINADQNIATPISNAGDNAFITCSDSETILDGGDSSSGMDYTYEWINEGGVTVGEAITVEVTETGTYTLIVTDETNGCTDSSTVDVEPDADLPIADAGEGATLTCAVNEVQLDASDSSMGMNISYEWFDPDNESLGADLEIDVLLPGTYTIVVTNNDNGCTSTSSVEVEEDITLPNIELNTIPDLSCSETTASISAINPGGNFSFEWEDVNGMGIGTGTEIIIEETGTYTVIATDIRNGCSEIAIFEVMPDTLAPIADAGTDEALTCDNMMETLDGSNSTGGTLSYEWFDEDGISVGEVAMVETSDAGIYTLLVTNEDNGCTDSEMVELIENTQPPIADAGLDTLLNCSDSMVVLDGSNSMGGFFLNYEWQDADGNTIENEVTTEVSEVGNYTLIVTNPENGCTQSDEVIVDGDFETPIVDPGTADLLTCSQMSISLDGSNSTGNGNLTFEWLSENDVSIGLDTIVEVSDPGTYTLLVTNTENGCTQSEQISISQNIIPPTANAGQGAFLTCDETEVTLTGSGTSQSGNTAYEWRNEGGVVVGNTPSVEVNEIGMYTLIITDDFNGCTATSMVEVLPDANLPTANAGTSLTLTCSNTEVLLDGSNSSTGMNITYEWQDSLAMTIGDTPLQMVTLPGIYTLIVTDTNNGCTATSTVEILEDTNPPNANAGMNATLTCEDNEVILNGAGSTVPTGVINGYEWYDSDGNLLSNLAFADVEAAGIYTLIITGSNGCTDSDEVEVLLDANVPEAIVGTGGLLTCETISLELGDVNSNTGLNVSYEWTNSNGDIIDVTPTIAISEPDTYTLLVTNLDNDCQASANLQVLQDITPPIADAGIDETLTCILLDYELGGATTSTGVMFAYEWQDATMALISDQINTVVADSGDYTLIVTNTMNACTATSTVSIDQDIQNPIADAGNEGVLTCDISEVALDGSNSMGTNLSYEWQNEAGVIVDVLPMISVSETGTFTLIVTNGTNGCTAEATTMVIPDANLPTAIASPDGILTCTIEQVNLDAGASTTTSGMIAYEWRDDMGILVSDQEDFDVNTPGIYTLTVTDENNNCSSNTSVEVVQDILAPSADAGPQQTLICGQTETTLNGVAGNGTNFNFEWQDDQGNTIGNVASVEVTSAGTYTFIVTNGDNGCSTSSTVDVVPDTNLPTADAGSGGILTCETIIWTINGNNSSQGTNFEYEWQDQSGNIVSNELMFEVSDPGTYTLTVLDTDNNCTAQDQVTITQDINDPVAFADYLSVQSLDCNNASIILDASGSNPLNDLDFEWSTMDGNISSGSMDVNAEVNQPGTYILTVTNTVNGCTSTTEINVDQDLTAPSVLISEPDLITCLVTTIDLDASASSIGDFSYNWTGNGIVSGEMTLQPTVNQSGTFTLTIIDNENGCENEASINVDENTMPPVAFASVEETLDCIIESVSLNGNGSSSGTDFSYDWQGNGTIDNATTISPTVYEAGVYTLLVTDASNGCTQTDEVEVLEDTDVPNSVELSLDLPSCFGESGNVSVLSVDGGDTPYLYSLDNGENFSAQTSYTNLAPGTYALIVQDANGCEYEEEILIPAPAEVEVDVEPSVLIQLGENYQMDVLTNVDEQDIDTIIWAPTTGLSCTDCLNPTVDITETSIYTVTLINQNGCSDTEEIILRVQKDRDIYIPNLFSPNNDGINDIFLIHANEATVSQITSFQVFDRWGEVVFSKNNFLPNNPVHGWDGRLNGEKLNPGVFVYWARIQFIDGQSFIYKGDVTITK